MAKEIPILFSTAMVQAILAGRKTQTRRVIKRELDSRGLRFVTGWEDWHGRLIKCPYGDDGDILWVRETWQHTSTAINLSNDDENAGYIYKASENGKDWDSNTDEWKWKPSIYMPKEAARIWLKVKSIRVERLQDISENDAKAEGLYMPDRLKPLNLQDYYKSAFKVLWEGLNGIESWKSNPWVWVVEYEVLSTTGKPAAL